MADPNFADKTARREALLQRVEHIMELPLTLLAFATIPLLAASFVYHLSPQTEAIVIALDVFVWSVFAADLVVKFAIAPDKLRYLRQHWIDVLIVGVPFFRPLRLLRVILYLVRGTQGVRRLVQFDYMMVYAIGIILVFATAVTVVERGSGSPLEQFPNALWWAIVTITTVGYGDMVPATALGKGLGIALMLAGIGIFGAVVANFAASLQESPKYDGETAVLIEEVKALRAEVQDLRGRL